MNYLITGGLGFVGRNLCRHFLNAGHQVTATGLSKNPSLIDHPVFKYVSADTTKTGKWQEMVKDQDVVINLAGKNIFTRWTEKSKRAIYDSRILTTRNLVEAISENQPITLLSTSAVGYYGDGKDALLRENSPPGDDFLASLSVDWETVIRIGGDDNPRLPRLSTVSRRYPPGEARSTSYRYENRSVPPDLPFWIYRPTSPRGILFRVCLSG